MQAIQNILTLAIEATVIIGFGGIVAHAFITSHCRWMATYCPPITSFQEPMPEIYLEDLEAPQEPAIAQQEPVEEIYLEDLEIAQEAEVPLALTFEDIDNNYKLPILQKLCDQHGIAWKNVRGKGKHMLKGHMIQTLMTAGVF